jgi:hypothetical protein
MLLKIASYLLFLFAFGVWTYACFKLAKKGQSDMILGKSFLTNELVLLLSYCGLFGFIYLLSGLWDLQLVILFLVASHAGQLLALVANKVVSSDSDRGNQRALWAGAEAAISQTKLVATANIINALVFFAYPIVAGFLLFRHPWGSEVLKVEVVKYSLLMLILAGYPMLILLTVSMLASQNLDEDTRRRVFINQLSGLIPNALLMALAVWAFGGGSATIPSDVTDLSHTLSVTTLLTMVGIFTSVILIPFLVGSQSGWRAKLLERKKEFVKALSLILKSPTPKNYSKHLGDFRQKLADARSALVAKDSFLTLVEELQRDSSQVPEGSEAWLSAISQSSDLDPRYQFLEYLSQLDKEVERIGLDLEAEAEEKRSPIAAQACRGSAA